MLRSQCVCRNALLSHMMPRHLQEAISPSNLKPATAQAKQRLQKQLYVPQLQHLACPACRASELHLLSSWSTVTQRDGGGGIFAPSPLLFVKRLCQQVVSLDCCDTSSTRCTSCRIGIQHKLQAAKQARMDLARTKPWRLTKQTYLVDAAITEVLSGHHILYA